MFTNSVSTVLIGELYCPAPTDYEVRNGKTVY